MSRSWITSSCSGKRSACSMTELLTKSRPESVAGKKPLIAKDYLQQAPFQPMGCQNLFGEAEPLRLSFQ